MIYLEEFNHYEHYHVLDPLTGSTQPVPKRDDRFFGFLAFLEPGLPAALYKERGVLTLQIGRQRWADSPDLRTTYEHLTGGTTRFGLWRGEAQLYERTYPSWWRHPDAVILVAEGAPPDEEEDFLAYVHHTLNAHKAGGKFDLVWHSSN